MTCIAGYIEDGHIYMGGDSGAFDEDGWGVVLTKQPKVFLCDEFIIGFSGSFRAGQILKYNFEPPPLKEVTHEFMVKTFLEEVKRTFLLHEFENEETEFLVGCRGRLFEIGNDFTIIETSDDYAAIGCGGDSARGAFFGLKEYEMEPLERVDTALRAAEYCNAGVRGPFHLLEL